MDGASRIAVLAASMLAASCATRSYAPEGESGVAQLRVAAGNEIRVVTLARDQITLRVDSVLQDRFVGTTLEPRGRDSRPAGVHVEVPYEQIAMIQVSGTGVDRHAVATAAVFTVAIGALVVSGMPVIVPP